MSAIEVPEKFQQLPERVRKDLCSGKGVTLWGLSGYNAYDNQTSYVTLFYTDDRWFLAKRDDRWNLMSREEIDDEKAQNLLCDLYPRPYQCLESLGISSPEEVGKIYSAKKLYRYQAKPSGFGGRAETLHHTSNGRWLLLTVIDDDTDPSRTLYLWDVLTEGNAQKWIEMREPLAM